MVSLVFLLFIVIIKGTWSFILEKARTRKSAVMMRKLQVISATLTPEFVMVLVPIALQL